MTDKKKTASKAATTTSVKAAATAGSKFEGFTADERAAMKERAKELKAAARNADGQTSLLAKIAEMPDADRALAERIHAVVTAVAPELSQQTWYGFPAYARDGQIVCFFQAAAKFKSRYATLGFNEAAKLDDDGMWPTSFALTKWTPEIEKKITALVKKAAG